MTAKDKAKRFLTNLRVQAEQHPLEALAIGAMVVTATAKLLEANTQRGYQKAHAKEIDRRIAQQYMKTR